LPFELQQANQPTSRSTNIGFLYLSSALAFQSAKVWAENSLNAQPSMRGRFSGHAKTTSQTVNMDKRNGKSCFT
jgi:hypothetical protein